jgi:hypothetical protein
MNLTSLITKGGLRQIATATPATFATHEPYSPKITASPNATAEVSIGTTSNADRWCWPHSNAMNSVEIDTFIVRLSIFADKGLSLGDREALADRLVFRDRESDDRRACLECIHLTGRAKNQACSNWEAAAGKTKDSPLSNEYVRKLQLCNGFK